MQLTSQCKVLRVCVKSSPTLWDPMNCSPPGSSVHGIFQARILEWVVISSSRGSSQTHVFCISCIGRWILYHWAAQASPKHSGGAQSGQLINIKAISLPPSLSTEGTISPTPFQNTLNSLHAQINGRCQRVLLVSWYHFYQCLTITPPFGDPYHPCILFFHSGSNQLFCST